MKTLQRVIQRASLRSAIVIVAAGLAISSTSFIQATQLSTPKGRGSALEAPNLPAGFAKTFTSRYVNAGPVRMHAVIGGDGPPLLLVHGWPQTWYQWRLVMPALARNFTVIAVDQRGIGLSDKPASGYDIGTLANDLVALMDALGYRRFAMVGFDTGMPIGYALAADHPERLDRLIVGEAIIPGVTPSPPLVTPGPLNARLWHIAFNRLAGDVNERLVRGREDVYFGAEYANSAGTPLPGKVVKYYIDRLASDPEALRGSFEWYRAIDVTIAQNEQRKKHRLSLPILAIGGAKGLGEGTASTMKLVADNVQTAIIPGSGHWVAEEAPEQLLAAITPFLAPYQTGRIAAAQREEIAASNDNDTTIRPFNIHVPDEKLIDLKRRLAATRWPDTETVGDQSQGVQSATMKELVRYWQTDYDWRKAEAKLNALPQFVTTIDGLDIHFIHVRSKQQNALPLIITHGWPGSIIEQLKVIDLLTNPTTHGASASDAFDVVIPSIPGYGFSARPTATGWNHDRIARAWDTLMKRLGYARYVAQGGDVGARVSEALARQAPQGLLGIHINLLLNFPPEISRAIALGEPAPAGLSEKEKRAYDQRRAFNLGYLIEQNTRPQTIGFSLADSPAGLASWILDHDANTYRLIAHAFDGHSDDLTRDDILDNITLYWLTNTGASAARLYWEGARLAYKGKVSVPAGFTVFPGEIWGAPRSWVENTFSNLIYYHEVEKGGHFAAFEQPKLFAEEIRAAFRSLR